MSPVLVAKSANMTAAASFLVVDMVSVVSGIGRGVHCKGQNILSNTGLTETYSAAIQPRRRAPGLLHDARQSGLIYTQLPPLHKSSLS